MYRPISVLSLLALAVPVAPAAAAVIDVRGPAPDHSEIRDAVLAAQDGDVIRVWPGTYQAFWIDDTALTLVSADDSGPVRVEGTYRIMNLAAHRSVEISGVSAEGIDGNGLVVSRCQGSVRIRESVFKGGYSDSHQASLYGVLVQDCADVELTSCAARGGSRYYPIVVQPPGSDGSPGLAIADSRVSLFDSTFEGPDGGDGQDGGSHGGRGGSGVTASGVGTVYLSGCTLIGGDGGNGGFDWLFWGDGGSGGWGYRADAGVESWFLDSVFQPGLGGTGEFDGSDGQAHSSGHQLPGASRRLRVSRLIDDQSTLGVIATGEPGDLVAVRWSDAPGYLFSPLHGPYLLSPPPPPAMRRHPWKILGTIDGTGKLITSLPVVDLPAFGHRTLHLQGNLAGSENYFTSSSWTVILDAAW